MNVLYVFVGGGVGAAARYLVSGLVYRWIDPAFPYGTLVVNITGCFLIGFLASIFQDRFLVNTSLRLFLTIGILGGFTTFSTFSLETLHMLQEGSTALALLNIGGSIVGGLLASWVGIFLGRMV